MSQQHPVVLIIDDEEDMRDMLAFTLSAEGIEPVSVDGGLAALRAVRERKFDLAITDLRMPGMDGIETLTALKRLDPELQVIVATAYASPETSAICENRGALGCLHKPYSMGALDSLLQTALARRYGDDPTGDGPPPKR